MCKALYLSIVQQEATRRDYRFDQTKILCTENHIEPISVTDQQINYEWQHLQQKLAIRDIEMLISNSS